ncbi:MAG: FAD-dependent oxidoreductase [Myxococcota bacterium]
MILVLGAGAAGLAAARTLGAAGGLSYTVSERSAVARGFDVLCGEEPAKLYQAFFQWLRWSERHAAPGESLASTLTRWPARGTVAQSRFFRAFMEQWLAGPLDQISAEHWDADEDLPGGDAVPGAGYGAVVSRLADGLDVTLGFEVSQVVDMGDRVRVGSRDGRSVDGDAIIVTLPLGVLRSGAVSFAPDLETSRIEALHRMGFGALEKVALAFESPFWQHDDHHLLAVYPTEEDPWATFYPLSPYGHGQRIVALTGGRASAFVSTWDDAQLTRSAMDALRRHYPGAPEPVHMLRTGWASDRFSRGSYSFPATGMDPSDYDRLAQPLTPRILFAGEATHRLHPATVHGAYESGVREAHRLLGGGLASRHGSAA